MSGFGDRLWAATRHRGPLCVGIDPHPELMVAWGLPVTADGLEDFAEICVEAFTGEVAIVKPQVAFFEVFGSAGIAVLERIITVLRGSGTLVLADAKRGDIGSTMAAYARAWLADGSPLAADAVTVSPYLGFGSLEPALALAEQTRRGVFVLAATSNPEGIQIQGAIGSNGLRVSQIIVDEVAAKNAAAKNAAGGAIRHQGSVGVVVGATRTDVPDLSGLGGPILMPGIGTQGGSPEDVKRIAGDNLHAVLPTTAREILAAGPEVSALRGAARRACERFSFLLD